MPHFPFWCRECERGFYSERALEQHNEDVGHYESDLDEEWECDYCDRVCGSQEAINQHTRDCHPKPHQCYTCYQRFATRDEMFAHKAQQHQAVVGQIVPQPAPAIVAPSVATLVQVVQTAVQSTLQPTVQAAVQTAVQNVVQALPAPRSVEVSQQLVACNTPNCGGKFTSVKARDLHIMKMHQNTCPTCRKVLATSDLLLDHISDNHIFKCIAPNCGAFFTTPEELNLHSAQSHKHKCDQCEKAFPNLEGLLEHRDSTHQYRCHHEGCGASFGSSKDRDDHVLGSIHDHACDECKKILPDTKSLLKHVNNMHRHKCDKCKDIFPSLGRLFLHKHSCLPFSCDTSGCDAHFSSQVDLELHLTSHQHSCEECPKLLASIKDLSVHQFRCDVESCGAWFDSKERLEVHTGLHESMMAQKSQDTQSDENSFYDAGEHATGSTSDSASGLG